MSDFVRLNEWVVAGDTLIGGQSEADLPSVHVLRPAAHGPWSMSSKVSGDERCFPPFASRRQFGGKKSAK